jgi:cell division protein FtsA
MKKSPHTSYHASIDIGSSKISCWIGSRKNEKWHILGAGQVASQGLWGGHITSPRALEHSLTRSLYEAESQAKTQVRRAVVSLNGSFFSFGTCSVTIPITGACVSDQDVQILMSRIANPGYHLIQKVPLEFQVDQQHHIVDPRGMVGSTLKGFFHVTWMDISRFQTLLSCFKRCQIQVTDLLFSGQGSALSCLTADEQELGSIIVDIGASSTSASLVVDQKLIRSASILIGGHHITQDIARGCEIPLAQAERIKILHGAALSTFHDYQGVVPTDSEPHAENISSQIPRSFLMKIIQARCEEILESIKKDINSFGKKIVYPRIVLVGGTAQLPGVRELAHRILGGSVKIGQPLSLSGAPQNYGDSSAVVGGFLHVKSPLDTLLSEKNLWTSALSWIRKKL